MHYSVRGQTCLESTVTYPSTCVSLSYHNHLAILISHKVTLYQSEYHSRYLCSTQQESRFHRSLVCMYVTKQFILQERLGRSICVCVCVCACACVYEMDQSTIQFQIQNSKGKDEYSAEEDFLGGFPLQLTKVAMYCLCFKSPRIRYKINFWWSQVLMNYCRTKNNNKNSTLWY